MVWAGNPFAHRIDFVTGDPVGDISYQVLGNDQSVLVDATVTPEAGAVSTLIVIAGTHNTVATDLIEMRTLTWTYTTADGVVSDMVTYRVDKPIPFAVSPDGVRAKLGVERKELPNDRIDLVGAYAEFAELMPDGTLAVSSTAGDRTTILCIHAIEALAGLSHVATIQMSAAKSESSGTNEFTRFGGIEWDRLEGDLRAHVARAREALDPDFDANGGSAFIFGVAGRETDAVTGEGL